MNPKSLLNVVLILAVTGISAFEASVVKLVPPKLSEKTISQKIVCKRPMRDGRFNISITEQGKKKIVNCYGHGGSGYTTLFGSVSKAIELFEKANPDKKIPIRVVGSGCMGLTCAIELARLGYHVSGITTKNLLDITSYKAAGYFALVSVKTSPEEQKNLNEIGEKTFLTYQLIDQGKHPYISSSAVRFMPVYCSEETETGVEDLEERGLIPAKEYVTLDFGNGVIHPGFVKYMTYFMNTTNIMRQLTAEVKRLAIPFEIKAITNFDEVKENVIFNCTGLGAKELNKDQALIAVRGHLLTLTDDSGSEHMDYMIYTKVKQDGKDEYIYLFPKDFSIAADNLEGSTCKGVLGGTFIPNVESLSAEEQKQLDQREFKKMYDRNVTFFFGK